MFCGIIEHQAKILSCEWGVFRVENTFYSRVGEDTRSMPAEGWQEVESLKLGQSIAHDGACMTLTKITPEYYEFFSMQESLLVTNFSSKRVGNMFNVERCLKLWDRIDGHFVSGHIDTVWKVILLEKQSDGSLIFGVSYDPRYTPLVIKKWSITINGVSLTVVDIEPGSLTVSLIPLTQEWTNLGRSKLWESVNLEFDMLGKYIQQFKNNN